MNSKMFVLLSLLMFFGCEKPSVLDDDTPLKPSSPNITICISTLEEIPFGVQTKSDASALCSRLTFAVFQNDEKVTTINQTAGDDDFGTVNMTLEEGAYQVVVIAHNNAGNATVSSTEKITFPGNQVSDTFYYYGDINVDGEPHTYLVELKRAAAMFRLVVSDDIPSSVATMKFYYTGGSSTFSAKAGYGIVNSRQTAVISKGSGQNVFEVYTLPKADSGTLKMTVTALDTNEVTIKEHVFEDLPVTVNKITVYTGKFFNGVGNEDTANTNAWTFTVNGLWDGISDYPF